MMVKAFNLHPPLWALHLLLVLLVSPRNTATAQGDDCAVLYNYDCYGCILNGCYWCPGDALCSSVPGGGGIGKSFFQRDGKLDVGTYVASQKFSLVASPLQSSCPKVGDYVTSTCTADKFDTIIDGRTSSSSDENLFSDPNYSAQEWVFDMINIQPVWAKNYFGVGIHVRVNDGKISSSASTDSNNDSMGSTPELDPVRIDLEGSCTYNIEDLHDDDDDDDNNIADDDEPLIGNTVASILGAAGGNDQCGVGVAPEVTFSTCRPPNNITSLISGPSLSSAFLAYNVDRMDISQNSWSATLDNTMMSAIPETAMRRRLQSLRGVSAPSLCPDGGYGCHIGRLDPITLLYDELPALVRGIEKGRDGRGVIYVFAAGDGDGYATSMIQIRNDLEVFDSMCAPWYNTRYTISVGAVGKNGLHAYYSAQSAALFVTAPGGNIRDSVSNMIGLDDDGRCTDIGQGTGLATPVVSAVVALMLEANPQLTWRDVRAIIANTSRRVERESSDDRTAAINSAGYWHSNKYGFGIIQADSAIETSETWELLGRELSLVLYSQQRLYIPISDNSSEPTSDLINVQQIESHVPIVIETIYLLVKIQTLTPKHRLHIQLTSPGGMTSTWTPSIERTSDDSEWYKFVTVRSWGESPEGDKWSLSMYESKSETSTDDGDDNDDEEEYSDKNVLVEWRLCIFGHEGHPVQTSSPRPTPLPVQSPTIPPVEGSSCQSIGRCSYVFSGRFNNSSDECDRPIL